MAKRKAAQVIKRGVMAKSGKSKNMKKSLANIKQKISKKDLWTTLSGGKSSQDGKIFFGYQPAPGFRCFLDTAWGANCCDNAAGSLNLEMAISLAVDSDKNRDSEFVAANSKFVRNASEKDLLKWKGLKAGRGRLAEIDINQHALEALERRLAAGTASVTDMLRASCYGIGICMPRTSSTISNSINYCGKLPGTKFSTNVNPGSVCRTLTSKAEVHAAVSEIETFARFGPFVNHEIGMCMLEELLQEDETSWIEHKKPYKFKKDANCKPVMDMAKHHIDRLLQEPEHTAAVFVRSVSGSFKPLKDEESDACGDSDDDVYERSCRFLSEKEKQALETNFGVKDFKCQRDMSGGPLPAGKAELCVDYVLWLRSNSDGRIVRYGISGFFSGDMGMC